MTETLHREVAVRIAQDGDGRTLVSRLVPYGEVATVNDGDGPYQETFDTGAFKAQMRAAHRIKAFLNFRHRQGLSDIIGHAANIEDRGDGLHGELRVLDVPDGDKALKLVEAGELDRISIEFQPVKDDVIDGVVHRVAARLLGVALVPEGAYGGAQVIAVREDETIDVTSFAYNDDLPVIEPPDDLDPELKARLARFVDMTPPPDVLERLDSLL